MEPVSTMMPIAYPTTRSGSEETTLVTSVARSGHRDRLGKRAEILETWCSLASAPASRDPHPIAHSGDSGNCSAADAARVSQTVARPRSLLQLPSRSFALLQGGLRFVTTLLRSTVERVVCKGHEAGTQF